MARPRSEKVIRLKETLLSRLADPLRPPGTRFLSARDVASLYRVSYQTAHRLLAELKAEGKLSRRPASGTFRPGAVAKLVGVELVFHERARRADSFGARLLLAMRERLARDRIDAKMLWYRDRVNRLSADRLPVIWETPLVLQTCVAARRPALLLNDRPPPGMDSLHIDSVGLDDFSGGAMAGQLLLRRCGSKATFVIVAGPADDRRSIARVNGCRSTLGTRVRVIHAGGWYLQHGLDVAQRVLKTSPAAIFCCNDRLAEAIVETTGRSNQRLPAVVGFDDAPVAENLKLTTVAIPWEELTGLASAVVRRRLNGDSGTASHQAVMPRPIIRWTSGSDSH